MKLCFGIRIRACTPYSGVDEGRDGGGDRLLAQHSGGERLPHLFLQLLRFPMYCSHFVTRVKEGNLLLIKILKELDGFLLHNSQIMLCTNTVEARKDCIIHLANRQAARSETQGKNGVKRSGVTVRCTEL